MSKKWKITLVMILTILVISTSFITGCIVGFGSSKSPDYVLINQAWNAIYQNYVDQSKLDRVTQSRGAIKGILDSLDDPYSTFLDPSDYQLFETDLEGNFQGIGAQISMNSDDQPVITAIVENSPASMSGLKVGDILLAIDGKSTGDMSLTEIVLNVRGPEGTTVIITVLHEDETVQVDIPIVRAEISQSTVSAEMKNNVLYMRIREFAETTNDDINAVLIANDLQNTNGIILDLRSNPGGLVTSVIDVISHFIKEGIIITLVDNQGNDTSESVNPNGVYTDLPIVVLVDQYSASASEILAGSLQDYKRATIAGVTTYGKGSYNINIQLRDGSDIYLTVGRWLTPNGRPIEGIGIKPDFILDVTDDAEIEWAINYLNGQQ
jgi:carboxyl-terminal processing protease